ncbi:tetratricopeptide repeat protein [Kitasatospora sp. P5_F3]
MQHCNEVGVAEYLAAGPQLMIDWKGAWAPGLNPRGAALVAAAVDFKRIGVGWSIPRHVLESVHGEYLEQRGGARLRPESIQDAFHWATQPLHATSSLLIPVGDDTYVAFDYLPDALSRDVSAPRLPDFIWKYALESLPPNALHFIGHKAEELGRMEIAESAYMRSADAGVGHGSFHLGYFAIQRAESEEAEYWFRKAISQGNLLAHANLGTILQKSGRLPEALDTLRAGASKGDHVSAQHLADYYSAEKSWLAAEEFFESLIDTQSPMAKMTLGRLKLDQGSYDLAWDWLNAAVLEGKNEAYFYLGRLHEDRGDTDAAEESYEIAISHGFGRARNNLATLLYHAKRLEEAEKLLRQLSDSDRRAAFNLAVILGETGRESEAEKLYRECIDGGSTPAKTNLAILISKRGEESEALRLFREAADSGDPHAMNALAKRLRREGSLREALAWCNKAIEAGLTEAFTEMGLIQEGMGNAQLARFWYKRAVDLGELSSAVCLGYLMERSRKWREAIRLYEQAAQGGNSHAHYHLGYFYLSRNKIDRAISAFETALAQGEEVSEVLEQLYAYVGDHEKRDRLVSDMRTWEPAAVDSD